mmetsp:Transcript_28850/g.43570  ORF Transcript_28850/g.43570 Transcript_28850/m.43570 type:complete len:115 (+) Transcript_28850:1-345(+)
MEALSSDSFSLREQGRHRLLIETFSQIKTKKAKLSPEYIILVVDRRSASLVSSFCTHLDLVKHCGIYQIEKLETQRKRYPQSDAIYLLDPNDAESIQSLTKDFLPDDEDPINYD